jgi:hypothetical protein
MYLQNIANCKLSIFIAGSLGEFKFTPKIIIGWVAVTAGIAAIDFAGAVAFGVDYGRLKVTARIPETLH